MNYIGTTYHYQVLLNVYIFLTTSATESVTRANLESAKRSILYSIKEEAKVTRTLIATNSNTNLIEKIMQEENIVGLPALDLESFLDFEDFEIEKQLKTDIELIKKIVRFISEIVQFYMSFNFC